MPAIHIFMNKTRLTSTTCEQGSASGFLRSYKKALFPVLGCGLIRPKLVLAFCHQIVIPPATLNRTVQLGKDSSLIPPPTLNPNPNP